MALTIETGAGVPGANSYATVAECEAWAVAYYGQSLAGSPQNKEAAIRRAFAYMNSLSWRGEKTHGRGQGGAWPREGVNGIDDDEIPSEVIFAQHAFARAEFQSPGVLTPSVVANERIKREKVGPLEVEYADGSASVAASRPVVTQAMDAIAHLLHPKRASLFLERA